MRTCTVEGCDRPTRNNTSPYCEKHYTRWKRHGDPTVALKDHTPAQERWKTSYAVDPETGCWNWIKRGSTRTGGYGLISDGAARQSIPAHVFVYEQVIGPVPEGKELDHTCNNKGCVNPEHLEPVTHGINIKRGYERGNAKDDAEKRRIREAQRKRRGSTLTGPAQPNSAKTYCKYGHEFTAENIIRTKSGGRNCRECHRRDMREYMRRKRAGQK